MVLLSEFATQFGEQWLQRILLTLNTLFTGIWVLSKIEEVRGHLARRGHH
jgi:hypothetical protein